MGATLSVICVNDEVARIYQHSKHAEEYMRPSLSARSCVELARYIHISLNKYAALGPDLTVITFDDTQNLVSMHPS